MIGEGWVAEETLGIAVYCALRHQDDFSAGIIAAVNHGGDSDSTGAVTGNILGALLGYEAIDQKWKKDLELSDVILEMADDLCPRLPDGGIQPLPGSGLGTEIYFHALEASELSEIGWRIFEHRRIHRLCRFRSNEPDAAGWADLIVLMEIGESE